MAREPRETGGGLLPQPGSPLALDPFHRLRSDMDDLFGRYFRRFLPEDGTGDMLVALDIAESDDGYEFKLDVPGVKRGDLDIGFEQGRLTVRGERRHEAEEKKKTYRRSERVHGRFATSFALPADVDGDRIEADLKDGVLTIHVPKSDDAKKQARKIAIKGR